MPHVLHPKTVEMLNDLPPFEQESHDVRGLLDPLGRELALVEAAAERMRLKFFPHNADDEFRTLGMWERLFGLPVEPVGPSEATRRAKVMANFQARKSGSGSSWIDLITAALETGDWAHTENGDYSVTVLFPVGAGGYGAAALNQLLRRITPAHLAIAASYSNGFIIGGGISDPDASRVAYELV